MEIESVDGTAGRVDSVRGVGLLLGELTLPMATRGEREESALVWVSARWWVRVWSGSSWSDLVQLELGPAAHTRTRLQNTHSTRMSHVHNYLMHYSVLAHPARAVWSTCACSACRAHPRQ